MSMLPAELIAINRNMIGCARMRYATPLSESNLSGIAINETLSYRDALIKRIDSVAGYLLISFFVFL